MLTLVDLLEPEWSGISERRRSMRYNDYSHVNRVIARTVDAVQDRVLEPAMPAMDLVDRLLGPVDELLISRLITRWRETMWQNACRLLEAGRPDERTVLLGHVEKEALKLGALICFD